MELPSSASSSAPSSAPASMFRASSASSSANVTVELWDYGISTGSFLFKARLPSLLGLSFGAAALSLRKFTTQTYLGHFRFQCCWVSCLHTVLVSWTFLRTIYVQRCTHLSSSGLSYPALRTLPAALRICFCSDPPMRELSQALLCFSSLLKEQICEFNLLIIFIND